LEKKSTFLLRYDIKPEEESIIWKSRNDPEWQLYLIEEKKVYVSELVKPSEFDDAKKVDPYTVFSGLPITTAEDTIKIKEYYKTEENRFLWEHHLKEALQHEKDWDKTPWFLKLIFKRPDSQWIKDKIESIPIINITFKEAKYIVTVEECKPPDNNLYLSGFYEKVAGLPEFIYWTVYFELSEHEKQILEDIEEAAWKTGLTIRAVDAPQRKKFFVFGQPDIDRNESEYNRRKKQIADIFPRLPVIRNKRDAIGKTYKISMEKIEVR